MTFLGGDPEVDALRTDRYLDSLLAAGDRHARHAPADAELDSSLIAAANRLRRDLVRVHPSFRFEERLALRLGEAAASMRLAPAVGGEGSVTSLVVRRDAPDEDASEREDGLRPLILGGALTSAALSIAGAAYVAWRRTRPGANLSPMARAVRAARAGRVRVNARSGLD
ncbi:MAG: hypothetical protein ACJ77B_02210 [Chloroflexota bacterium]